MKLKNNFIAQKIDGEQIMVATGDSKFSGIVKSNETAGFIIECLKEEISKENIIKKMIDKYDGSPEIISESVDNILDKLRQIGALDE